MHGQRQGQSADHPPAGGDEHGVEVRADSMVVRVEVDDANVAAPILVQALWINPRDAAAASRGPAPP
jgi:hypothetical protein